MRALYFLGHILAQIGGKSLTKHFINLEESPGDVSEDHEVSSLMGWSEVHWYNFIESTLHVMQSFGVNLGRLGVTIGELARLCVSEMLIHSQHGARMYLLCDKEYPTFLKWIQDPPLGLSVWGRPLEQYTQPLWAVVGSRKAPAYALQESFHIGALLIQSGMGVVSGGAYGCDISAHQGALSTKIHPLSGICVFAGGLGHLSPHGNRHVYRELIRQGGTFISERLWGYSPHPYDFTIRNRIISGLCSLTVVVYAGLHSGAMVTARMALDQGRDVWVLAPKFYAPGSEMLIEEGASMFDSVSSLGDKIHHLTPHLQPLSLLQLDGA